MFLLGFPMVLHIYVCLPKPTLENPIAESPAGDFVLLRCLVATMVLSFGSTFVYFFYTYGEETRHLADFRSRFLGGHKLTLDVGGIIVLLISLEVLMGKMGGSNGNKSSINGPFSSHPSFPEGHHFCCSNPSPGVRPPKPPRALHVEAAV
jgi:hypothetical protein